jgi:dynein heavy chain
MHLVLFDFAIMHILRICRILKMDKGNALLVGLGGSGRQSLARLAAFLMDQVIEQPEQAKNYNFDQWCEDIKAILYKAGCQD